MHQSLKLFNTKIRYMEPAEDKYMAPDDAYGRHAARTLLHNGREAVIAPAHSPKELMMVAVQEDASHVLLPKSYTDDDVSTLVHELDDYGKDDTTILRQISYDGEEDELLSSYHELPQDWEDVDGVGKQTAPILENTDIEPWDIDEQELNRELVKAYDVGTQRSIATRIKSQNPHLFEEQDYSTSDRPWPDA